ncbi:MAG: hypothetical protein N2442_12240, partial [Spirochaetes bacterium]|nr:hypothetical protein [Spirochaetota bacterium]
FALVRYNEDGSLDTSFGIGGIVTTQIGNTAGANGIAVQSDGKIILAGYAFMDSALTFTLARYNPNGSLDSTFGTGGKVTNKIGNYSIANGVKVQTDGKIIVVGSQKINNYTDFSIVRYKENGVLDTTFGNGGIVLTSLCPSNDSASCVANLSDGNILVGGYLKNGSSYDFALIRYKQDGSIDMSFGQEGKVITSIQTGDDRANKILIQSDGKIILVGYSSGTDFALARYNPDGSLDSSFGTGGKVTTKILYGNGSANAGILQPDGSIVVGGYVVSGSQKDFALARYKP